MLRLIVSLLIGATIGAAGPNGLTPAINMDSGSALRANPPFKVKCDGRTDDYPQIQAALDAIAGLPAGQRGTLALPSGTCAISQTLSVSVENVKLVGDGVGNVYGNNLSAPSNTRLKWIGASGGTMMTIAPPAQHGLPISGDDVRGILFDCNAGLAANGFQERSVSNATFDIGYVQCGRVGVSMDVQSNMTKYSDTQLNHVRIQGYDNLQGSIGVSADGTGSGGVGYGNTSENFFEVINVTFENGDGIHFGNTDHNHVGSVTATRLPGGTGAALVLLGSDSRTNGPARYNDFGYFATNAPIIARGTSSFRVASFKNWFDNLAYAQDGKGPVIEPGASLCVRGTDSQMVNGCLGTGYGGWGVDLHDGSMAGGNPGGLGSFDGSSVRSSPTEVPGNFAAQFGRAVTASGLGSFASGNSVVASGAGSRAHGSQALANLYGEDCISAGGVNGAGSSQSCSQNLRATVSGDHPVRLVADGKGTPDAVNCVNIPLQSAANLMILVTGLDRTAPPRSFAYTEPRALLAQGASATTMTYTASGSAATTPSVALPGAALSVTADTSAGCLNVTWTPPAGNTDIWDVAAEVHFQLVR